LVSKGNRKAQELKIPLRVFDMPPDTS